MIEIEFVCVMQGDVGIEGPRGGLGLPGKTVSKKAFSVTHHNQGFHLHITLNVFHFSQ